jgi:phosphoadenosine phosphosulfate reductase
MLNTATITNLESLSLVDALRTICEGYQPGEVVFSSSLGQEDQVLTDAIFRNQLPVRVFSIDTGRLFNDTYELLERTTARYKQPIELFFPNAADVEAYVVQNGINGFYESVDNRKACCHVRKVIPLNRALNGAKVWITGLRAEQSGNRKDMPMVEWMADRELYKVNPLIHWTYDQMMSYINEFNVPYNRLHDKGFISIGCAPCTRAIEQGEDARAGRWWWEASQKECGLHAAAR